MDTNTQLLHTIVAKLDNLDTRMCAIEAQGERHSFVQPKATKAVKAVKVAKKTASKAKVQSEVSKAHHAMKALLKAKPKEVQKAFTGCWLALRQDAGYGLKGSIPMPVYFELQMQAYNEVA
jgi:hypothetical protein